MIEQHQRYLLPSGRTVVAGYLIDGTSADWNFSYLDIGRQLTLTARFVLAYGERV